ncbi:hypothetical protein [Poriferisphaera sp. WC338]|uniref:hypothetical protein n=1 Tax=Poriferisphaera sp. WC338 TaxID=3425129 RepID=UPI003D815808
MGKRGPKPKAKKQPASKVKIPTCPTWLGATGKRYWKCITTNMLQRGTITDEYRELIGLFCEPNENHLGSIRLTSFRPTQDGGLQFANRVSTTGDLMNRACE